MPSLPVRPIDTFVLKSKLPLEVEVQGEKFQLVVDSASKQLLARNLTQSARRTDGQFYAPPIWKAGSTADLTKALYETGMQFAPADLGHQLLSKLVVRGDAAFIPKPETPKDAKFVVVDTKIGRTIQALRENPKSP
jgi:hypothetical protein